MQNEQKSRINILYSRDWQDYELLDTGDHQKLERFGKHTFVRPYEDAFWKKTLPQKEWEKADGIFFSSKKGVKSGWQINSKDGSWGGHLKNCPLKWNMSYKDINFYASPTPFRHLGFFPEQASHWDFIEEKIKNSKRKIRFLNLFGYTGIASLFALRAGADVTHLDASKQSVSWLKENQELSNFKGDAMRVIIDDAMKFIEREIKRGNKYDAVVMDPPKFGRGPKGETWKLEENLGKLLSQVRKILSDKPLFVILTSYATDSSSLSLAHTLEDTMKGFGGEVEAGELCVLEKSNKRVISLANTAIWEGLEK